MIILLTHSDNVWSDKPLLLSSLVIMFPPFFFFLILWIGQTCFLHWCLQARVLMIPRRLCSQSLTRGSEFPSFIYSYGLQADAVMMSTPRQISSPFEIRIKRVCLKESLSDASEYMGRQPGYYFFRMGFLSFILLAPLLL